MKRMQRIALSALLLLCSLCFACSLDAALDDQPPTVDEVSAPPETSDGIGTSPSLDDDPFDHKAELTLDAEQAAAMVIDMDTDLELISQCTEWEYYACGTTSDGGLLVCRYCVCWQIRGCSGAGCQGCVGD